MSVGTNPVALLGGSPLASGRAARTDPGARGIRYLATAQSDSPRCHPKRASGIARCAFSHGVGPNVCIHPRAKAGEASRSTSGAMRGWASLLRYEFYLKITANSLCIAL